MFRLLHGPLQQTAAQESDFGLVPSRVLRRGNTTCDQSQKSKSPTSAPPEPHLPRFLTSPHYLCVADGDTLNASPE